MIVRSLDENGDWQFGKGKNDYRVNKEALPQNLASRIRSFLGDCFFALDAGIDWFGLLGSNQRVALKLAVSATILNTKDVLKINSVLINYGENRTITMSYEIDTVYGIISSDSVLFKTNEILTTEEGDPLTDEDGNVLITG